MTSVREGEPTAGPGATAADPRWPPVLADAVHDGLSALERVLTGAGDGIAVVGPGGRFAYASPAACQLLGRPLEELRGRDFLASLPVPAHQAAARLPGEVGEPGVPFTCLVRGADGVGREIVCSTFAVELAGSPHWVAIFRDLSGPRTGARTALALALAQTAARPVTGTIEEALVGIARHAVEGTRALAAGIVVVSDDHKMAASGSYGHPDRMAVRTAWRAASPALEDLPGGDVLLTGRPVVLPDGRARWEADPLLAPIAATLAVGSQAVAYVPLLWEGQVLGVLIAHLPSGLDGPSGLELAFYTALADQAAVAAINARLAASLERARLAGELHDSVSQALFSMTMHARAAQLSMTQAGLDPSGPLGRAVAQLAGLAQGAMAEMRALIFELRPAALAEEGLMAALRAQGAALTAREGLAVTVDGPVGGLDLGAGTEEHLYRVVLEALHNVVKHAQAGRADVRVTARDGVVRVAVSDDGAGFDPGAGSEAGHLGLAGMAGRARAIGAGLTVTSAPGAGTTVALVLPYHPRKAARRA